MSCLVKGQLSVWSVLEGRWALWCSGRLVASKVVSWTLSGGSFLVVRAGTPSVTLAGPCGLWLPSCVGLLIIFLSSGFRVVCLVVRRRVCVCALVFCASLSVWCTDLGWSVPPALEHTHTQVSCPVHLTKPPSPVTPHP